MDLQAIRTHWQSSPWLWGGLTALLVVALLAFVGFRVAVQELRSQLTQALGPRSEIGELTVGWAGVEARQVRIRAAARGWPTGEELRAQRIVVTPSLAGFFSPGWHIARIRIEDGYLSLLRGRDGRLHVLPALLEREEAGNAARKAAAGESAPRILIGDVELDGAVIEFYDATVRQPPLRVRLQELDASIGPLDLPSLQSETSIDAEGVVKGVQRDGRITLRGGITLATKDSRLDARLSGVDLVALQPYLVKVSEAGVRRGTLDLNLNATVASQHLKAPGHLRLTGLELADAGGTMSSFAGVPRQALLAFMSKNDRIDIDFTLEGRLDDPGFSLNENLATRVASGLADKLGVSLGGVVEGVGSVIKGLFGR